MFDPQKQTLLRQLKGHQRPVHTTRFAPDKMHVLSGSDDATVSASTHDTFSLELAFPGLLPCCACTHPYRSVYAGSSKACWWMVISLWQHIFADAFPLLHCCMLICADTAGPTPQIRWWDITAGEQQFRLDGHSDYVRSSACSSASPDTWATGESSLSCSSPRPPAACFLGVSRSADSVRLCCLSSCAIAAEQEGVEVV